MRRLRGWQKDAIILRVQRQSPTEVSVTGILDCPKIAGVGSILVDGRTTVDHTHSTRLRGWKVWLLLLLMMMMLMMAVLDFWRRVVRVRLGMRSMHRNLHIV